MRRLSTVDQVIDALGGMDRVLELTGTNSKQTWNWQRRTGQFPAQWHDAMTKALRKRRCTAPPRLWNQKEFAA
jgi:hypothetical protein